MTLPKVSKDILGHDMHGTQLGLDEDLTPAQQAQKQAIWATFKEAKDAGEHVY
jgi:hypothetical protein